MIGRVSRELSLKLAGHVVPKQCFHNAFLAWPNLKDGVYVEGFALNAKTGFGPIGHGWLETADEVTVDPTFAHKIEEWVYFPAFRYRNRQEILQIIGKRKNLPVYEVCFGKGAINRAPELKRAYAQALIFCAENTPAQISASLCQWAKVILQEANYQLAESEKEAEWLDDKNSYHPSKPDVDAGNVGE